MAIRRFACFQCSSRLLVTQNMNQGGEGPLIFNNHPIGVHYDDGTPTQGGRWRIFNQDGSELPKGASFNVVLDPQIAPIKTVKTMTRGNISCLLFTMNPDDVIFLTSREITNKDPFVVRYYDGGDWCIVNAAGHAIAEGTSFFWRMLV